MLGVQPGSMSEIISKLEGKGFVTRERGEDRRGNTLRITDAGRAAIPKAAEAPDEDALFSALNADERKSLADMLRALLNDWADRMDSDRRGERDFSGFARPPRGAFVPLGGEGPEGEDPRGVQV